MATRIIQGMFNMYCAYLSIKYFPLVFVSLITNIAPLILAIFAYLIFREKLDRLDIINLLPLEALDRPLFAFPPCQG